MSGQPRNRSVGMNWSFICLFPSTVYIYIYIYIYVCRELNKVRGWTTFDVKKIENVIKTFRSETFFSYLQLLNKKEL